MSGAHGELGRRRNALSYAAAVVTFSGSRASIQQRRMRRGTPCGILVRVEIAVEGLGTTSLTTRETLRTPGGDVAAEARVITVRWGQESRTAVPFSDEQRARLAEFTV